MTLVSLNGSGRLNLHQKLSDNEIVANDCLLDVCARREKYQASTELNLTALSFLEFATKFRFSNGKLSNQQANFLPTIFPTYSSNPICPNYGCYCKYQPT